MNTKTLAITTKAQASAVFNKTPGARRVPYCMGRYSWSGSEKPYTGQPVERVRESVRAIYMEPCADGGEVWAEMMCVVASPKSRKTVKVSTRWEAYRVFRSTPGARRFPYCSGRYQWEGAVVDFVGRPIENAASDIKAIYVERRCDAQGPHARLMCIALS